MVSQTERDRQRILEQINNQGRILEKRLPADALKLNDQLRKVAEWLVARLDPRGPKGK